MITNTEADGIQTGTTNMKFIISSKELGEVLVNMNRVINTKNSLPILADIIFSVKENNLNLKASDGDIILESNVTLTEREGEGILAVNGKNIMDAVSNLPDTPLTFVVSEDKKSLKVGYTAGSFSMPIDDALSFPVFKETNTGAGISFEINEGLLQENIARTIFMTADDELRIVMNGIFFGLTTEELEVVASDGKQLVRNRIMSVKATNQERAGNFILPKKAANILKAILKKNTLDSVVVVSGETQLQIYAENFKFSCRLIEGRYPNYIAVIPKDNHNVATVDRDALAAALKRVSPFSNLCTQLVRIRVQEGEMQLFAEDDNFGKAAKERLACDYSGEAMSIGLNGYKIMEILNKIAAEKVEFKLAEPSRAAVIVPSEQPEDMDITMLLMPLLLCD